MVNAQRRSVANKEETDLYLQYLNECTKESDTHIKSADLYEDFKIWFKSGNPNAKIPSNKEFYKNTKKHKNIEKVLVDGKSVHGIKKLKLTEKK